MSVPYVPPDDPFIDPAVSQDGLQSMTELIYIKAGNDLLEGSLNELGQQVISTRDVLATLSDLQTLHNQLTITNRSGFNPNAYSTSEAYSSAASGYFSGISPTVNLSSTSLAQYNALKDTLQSQLEILSGFDPTQAGVTNSLLTRARQVLQDITDNSAQDWVMDNYEKPSPDSGQFQTNITFAVNSAQSLSSTQQEQVRSFMFVFEEFYKSASSVQSALKEIMTHMAQNMK